MEIHFRSGQYVSSGEANYAEMLTHGFKYNRLRDYWFTSKIEIAAKVASHCVGDAKIKVDAWIAQREQIVTASMALDSDIEIPSPPGCIYRPYQKAGISFAHARDNTLIADSMRLGKTVQAIGVANMMPQLCNMLVVSPSTVKINWHRELSKWLVHKELPIGIIEGKVNPEAPVSIINYDILTKHLDFLYDKVWDYVVFDEAHYLKNDKSQRTKAALGEKRANKPGIRARKRVFLTGTPIFTRPIDIWTLCQQCDPNGLGKSWWNFVHRYCDAKKQGYGGLDTDGASNMEELQYKLRRSFMIRREKTDVAAEIPPNRQTIVLPKKGLETVVAKETSIVRQNLAEFMKLIEGPIDRTAADQIVNDFSHFDGVAREYDPFTAAVTNFEAQAMLTAARKELALAKLKMCFEHMDQLLESEQKIVIFAHHRDVVAQLREHYPDAAVVIGGLTPARRQQEIDRFQADPNCRVFIGNIVAAGQGIALHASDVVCFVEMSWVPSEMDQAEERIWDVLKEHPISIYRYVVEGSIDEVMSQVLDLRQQHIEKAMKARRMQHARDESVGNDRSDDVLLFTEAVNSAAE